MGSDDNLRDPATGDYWQCQRCSQYLDADGTCPEGCSPPVKRPTAELAEVKASTALEEAYADCLAQGLSDSEARGTAWPDGDPMNYVDSPSPAVQKAIDRFQKRLAEVKGKQAAPLQRPPHKETKAMSDWITHIRNANERIDMAIRNGVECDEKIWAALDALAGRVAKMERLIFLADRVVGEPAPAAN